MSKKITIVDYATGNINVLVKKLKDFGFEAEYTNKANEIEKASFLLIPGVGHFSASMEKLKTDNLIDVLNKKVLHEKIPVIGICLGMQLFTKYSEEGNSSGLGWIDAQTKHFKFNDNNIKVPHIGWNTIHAKNNSFIKEFEIHRFYFVHSYYVECNNTSDVLTYTEYGGKQFCSSVQHDNILGFQFHPEKSHKEGMRMLANAIRTQMEKHES